MQAVILAAGMGKRLGSLTANNTKCMVNVLGEPLIKRAIYQIIRCGITNIVIVNGYKGENLTRYVNELLKDKPAITVHYVENPIYDVTINSAIKYT